MPGSCPKCGKVIPLWATAAGFTTCMSCSTIKDYTPIEDYGHYKVEPAAEDFIITGMGAMLVPFPEPVPNFTFGELTPADPVLEALGRAFDDGIDLAYLG